VVLCIDTATEQAGVALISDKACRYLPLDRAHTSDDILRKIDELIRMEKIKLSGLTGIFVIKGPGSFTGSRIGISVANQFSHQLKIPITGLLTDQWYSYRTNEKDFIYLQSMNRDQIYMSGYGKYLMDYPQSIVTLSECHYEIVSNPDIKWLGQLSKEHREVFSDSHGIKNLLPPDKTWLNVIKKLKMPVYRNYHLIEPYYGKKPTITKSNRKLYI